MISMYSRASETIFTVGRTAHSLNSPLVEMSKSIQYSFNKKLTKRNSRQDINSTHIYSQYEYLYNCLMILMILILACLHC